MILNPGDTAIDYSYSRPSPAAIVAAGVRLVVRYLSPRRDHAKNITALERDVLLAAGLGLLLVWEAAATDPLHGPDLGRTHGAQAGAFARDLGYPVSLPIIAAVDFQVVGQQITSVMGYLAAFRDACGYPMGVYGNDTMVTVAHEAGLSTLGWQTRAWSHGRLSPFADCRQEIGFVHPAVGTLGSVDDNTVLRSFTAWSTTPDPPPPPPVPEEDEMNPNRFVASSDGSFWEIGVDSEGQWAQTLEERKVDWRLYNPPTLGDPIPAAVLDEHHRPPVEPSPAAGFHDHVHAIVGTPVATGGVVP